MYYGYVFKQKHLTILSLNPFKVEFSSVDSKEKIAHKLRSSMYFGLGRVRLHIIEDTVSQFGTNHIIYTK